SGAAIRATWAAAAAGLGVTGYRVERCQGTGCTMCTQIDTTTGTSYSDTGLAPTTGYSYQVKAVGAAGKVSGASPAASATTVPDTTPPGAPASLTARTSVY